MTSAFTVGLASGLLAGFDSGFETFGSSRPIGTATGGRSLAGAPGRGAGGAFGAGSVAVVVGVGGPGPGFGPTPGVPGRPGGVMVDGLVTVVPDAAPLVAVVVGVGVAGVPLKTGTFGFGRE